jgi:hypothetical protein
MPFTRSVIHSSGFRRTPFSISHLRVFYTKLLTLVKEQDVRDENGEWYRAANDVAMYLPILEMVR